ncbi:MAG: response regulator, partial [Spirochaetales bacterium]|nr:response regulator [Spirochaetales bacterium]
VRGRISSRISEETGFAVVGTAGNGYDALELIEEHAPHVVLTDIKMPYIDGIELASIIRRDYPTTKVAFITGYNEFDYAREAIKLRVQAYLTKPLTEEAIRTFLDDLREELDREFEENFAPTIVQRQYEESVPLLIENSLTSVLLSRTSSVTVEVDQLMRYGVDLESERYVFCYIAVERNAEHWDVIEFEKLKMSVRSNVEKTLDSEELAFYGFFFNEGIALIVKRRGVSFAQDLDMALNRIVRTIERFQGVRIGIGVSEHHVSLCEVRAAYNEAMRAYEVGRLRSDGRLTYSGQLPERPRAYALLEEAEEARLNRALRYESAGRTHTVLAEIRDRVVGNGSAGGDTRLVMLSITDLLVRYSSVVDADLTQLAGADLIESVARMQSFDEFTGWAKRIVDDLQSYGRRSKMDNAERLLSRAEEYMERHVADKDLTMQSVCDAQGISVSYVGQLFKKYRNTTFVKYLTALRMERAKEMLRLSGSRITEVAEACGYRDVYYFSHCFRKYAGVPPKRYREQQ